MSGKKNNIEAVCPGCGKEALLLRTPLYEGFTRVGEILSCSLCGHEFENGADIGFIERGEASVFTEEDKPEAVKVFTEEDKPVFCRYCVHYVVNPFVQWCARHKKEIEATDTCSCYEEVEDELEEVGDAE